MTWTTSFTTAVAGSARSFLCKWDLAAAQWAGFTLRLKISPNEGDGPPAQAEGTMQLAGSDQSEPRTVDIKEEVRKMLARCALISVERQRTRKATMALLVLPARSGYIDRSDFLEHRLYGMRMAAEVHSFVKPLGAVQQATTDASLQELLHRAVGGVVLEPAVDSEAEQVTQSAEKELDERISFDWLSTQQPKQTRVAFVEGRRDYEGSGRIYEAAHALGISIVAIENAGHWLEPDDGPYAHLREAFIPTSMAVDAGFTERIVKAVRGYGKPIDGLMTVSDARLEGVARAAAELGLPTEAPAAFAVAGDKYRTRMAEADEETQAFRVSSVQEARQVASSVHFPAIVKPCLGWGSECVSRVANEQELVDAVAKATQRHAASPQKRTDAVIEPFIDGPEVDINLVLLDGEVVFWELLDDFPSPGDADDAPMQAGFLDTMMLVPSALPRSEQLAVRHHLRSSLLRLGFRTGVFHCEARLRNSRMTYDAHDLVESKRATGDVRVYVLEVNARPPGYLSSVPTHMTWGVDYYALQFLCQIGDKARFHRLASSFVQGPQWHLAIVILPEDRVGVVKTADAGRDMLDRDDELRKAVKNYKTIAVAGTRLLGPGANEVNWLAYFSVTSRQGRADLLRLTGKINQQYAYELEED